MPGSTANSLHPGVIETNLGRHIPNREEMYDRMRPTMKSLFFTTSTASVVFFPVGLQLVRIPHGSLRLVVCANVVRRAHEQRSEDCLLVL